MITGSTIIVILISDWIIILFNCCNLLYICSSNLYESMRQLNEYSLFFKAQFSKIDFKIIVMAPSDERIIQKNTLYLRYITLELCVSLNIENTKYDVVIPLDQVQKFHLLTSKREICLELKKDFTRYVSEIYLLIHLLFYK